ncbi:hypothetical protein LCGC14_1118480 [marine sediment metagenome]|uniref:Uncharacterized protein n=1 Tax=marine sediment metagenome TaxID=412755 RepID=A0A0F9M4M8_9ZZZZ
MSEKESYHLNVTVRGELAKYLKELRELGVSMSIFLTNAIENYITIHREKMEVLKKYNRAINKKQKFMNEE